MAVIGQRWYELGMKHISTRRRFLSKIVKAEKEARVSGRHLEEPDINFAYTQYLMEIADMMSNDLSTLKLAIKEGKNIREIEKLLKIDSIVATYIPKKKLGKKSYLGSCYTKGKDEFGKEFVVEKKKHNLFLDEKRKEFEERRRKRLEEKRKQDEEIIDEDDYDDGFDMDEDEE